MIRLYWSVQVEVPSQFNRQQGNTLLYETETRGDIKYVGMKINLMNLFSKVKNTIPLPLVAHTVVQAYGTQTYDLFGRLGLRLFTRRKHAIKMNYLLRAVSNPKNRERILQNFLTHVISPCDSLITG